MTDKFETSPARQPTVSKSAEHAPIRSVELRADWRARKWARERMATRCEEDRFPDVAESYRRGDRDESLRDDIEAYRAGQAASAERIKALEGALTPSAGTKYAYLGEFRQARGSRKVTIEWTTIKEIMQAIRDHADALLKEADQ